MRDLKNILRKHYKKVMIYKILNGERFPSYKKMLLLNKEHNIPFEAWEDIKSYIAKNPTKGKIANE